MQGQGGHQPSDLLVIAATASGLALWPAAFLLLGGFGKLLPDQDGWAEATAIEQLTPSWLPTVAVSASVGLVEFVVGALVLATLWLPWPEAAAALLLGSLGILAAVALQQKPGADCGCLGKVARAPLSRRTVARAGVLAAMVLAAAVAGQPWTAASHQPVAAAVVLAAGLGVCLGSPEVSAWRSQSQPRPRRFADCATAAIPVADTLAELRRDSLWDKALPYLRGPDVIDDWRDACWRYLCFSARYEETPATAVFAVYLGEERKANVVAFVADETNTTLGQLSATDG
jgi:hypothetical protein